jgi:hypothetical protein
MVSTVWKGDCRSHAKYFPATSTNGREAALFASMQKEMHRPWDQFSSGFPMQDNNARFLANRPRFSTPLTIRVSSDIKSPKTILVCLTRPGHAAS